MHDIVEKKTGAVVLLSGGLDSAVAGAIARDEGFEIIALTADYGQRHRIEIDRAGRVSEMLGVKKHVVVDLDLRAIGGSALTDRIPVPAAGGETGIPSTYVPARNTILLSLALALAEVEDVSDIFTGVNAVDYSGYPDCRPEFIEAFQSLAALATRKGTEEIGGFRIRAPLIDKTKAEIILKGHALGVDFSLTHSCYNPAPDETACGICDSCVIRKAGFSSAGVPDPTVYTSG